MKRPKDEESDEEEEEEVVRMWDVYMCIDRQTDR